MKAERLGLERGQSLANTGKVVWIGRGISVLGAILLAGYMGGATCTHWRVGEPFVIQAVLGVLVWLGLYLREERLRALLPLRR